MPKLEKQLTVRQMLEETFPNQLEFVAWLESVFEAERTEREVVKAFLEFVKRALVRRAVRMTIERSLIERFDVRHDRKRFDALANHVVNSRQMLDYNETVLFLATYLVVKGVPEMKREALAKLFTCVCAMLIEVSDLI